MQTHCPRCAMTLLVTNATHAGLYLCPYCQRTFPLPSQDIDRRVFVALDVSRSAVPFLAEMLSETRLLLQHQAETDRCAMRVFTFHRQLSPFPCERLCQPQHSDSLILPTLRDLRSRVAPGSACWMPSTNCSSNRKFRLANGVMCGC